MENIKFKLCSATQVAPKLMCGATIWRILNLLFIAIGWTIQIVHQIVVVGVNKRDSVIWF
jgi:hypothetical protein